MKILELYVEANRLAFIAMGTDAIREGHRVTKIHRANEDPLAHWLLTEAIVNLVRRDRRPKEIEG